MDDLQLIHMYNNVLIKKSNKNPCLYYQRNWSGPNKGQLENYIQHVNQLTQGI